MPCVPLRARLLPFVALCLPALAFAQSAGGQSAEDISRKLADPGAPVVSVPFQYNYLGSVGPGGDFHNQQLKVQPVIPFVGERGKFLLRPILPVAWNQYPQDRNGIGDLFVQGYYIPTPGTPSATEFGFGAAALLDTASSDSLGSGKYSLGPAFVLVHKTPKWTMGALANHVWSVAGDDDREDVSSTSLQPFFTRTLPHGWSLNFTSEASYNWKASSGNRWLVPAGMMVSKVERIGRLPVSFGVGGFYNIERPEYANRWTARLVVTLVLPE
ncbi:MAG TPA: hypothetical protein VD865_15605 [Stenotrophomonas sp.]|nr:hypothetical protein [Stenotrophomonas sp.]